MAMYKTRNTGTGNGMQGEEGMEECYIPRNVVNIPGNVNKHPVECPHTFRGMFSNNSGNVLKHSPFLYSWFYLNLFHNLRKPYIKL